MFCEQENTSYLSETISEKQQGTFEDSGDEFTENRFIIKAGKQFVAISFGYINGQKLYTEQGVQVYEIEPSEIKTKMEAAKQTTTFYQ